MAIQGVNSFPAGGQFIGIAGNLAVLGSSGLRVATFTQIGPGRYTIALEEQINPSALVCLLNATTVAGLPLIASASATNAIPGETTIIMNCDDAAGAPADGANMQLAIFRPLTAG